MHLTDPCPDGEPEISVVVPLYNEEENVAELHRRLARVLDGMTIPYEILFVNDGSRDATRSLIDRAANSGPTPIGHPLQPEFWSPAGCFGGA